ncbi:ribonuclease H-like protein [Jackrogersella minutella]|nr:ribonuclease H-like protein [Jackrogersella minutella]
MPLGWYLAQGLIPLGPSDSDDEEGPCELPNGRIVCGPHGFVVCHKCFTDYSDMEDVIDDTKKNKDDDSDDGALINEDRLFDLFGAGTEKKGTGRVIPTSFIPPTNSITRAPLELFPGQATRAHRLRYIHCDEPHSVLVFTDGACLNNGLSNPKAGWAFVYRPPHSSMAGPVAISARLETQGPFGDESIQTSNRAELRAVIAALGFRHWSSEGFRTMTIATDSAYVVEGATKGVWRWIRNGWKTVENEDVKNKDLWEMLFGEVEKWNEEGLSIRLWWIPRSLNKDADAAAKKAAERDTASATWIDPKISCSKEQLALS